VAFCNTDLIGKPFPAFSKVLTSEEALAYAKATDDNNPCYGAPHFLAPPLAMVTLSLVHGAAPILCDPELFDDPMLLLRLVHLEEDIVWHRPLKQNMSLVSNAVLADVEERSSGEILRIEVTIDEEVTGQPALGVAKVRTSMFLRGATGRARRSLLPKQDAALSSTQKLAWTVAADQSERYADASGDHNPIHVDDAMARSSGLKGRILHGLCTMAFAQRAVVQQFAGGDPARLGRLRVAFARPVYMGDTLIWAALAHQGSPNSVEFVVNNQADRSVCTDGLAVLRDLQDNLA
jgi:acyl dehydratase